MNISLNSIWSFNSFSCSQTDTQWLSTNIWTHTLNQPDWYNYCRIYNMRYSILCKSWIHIHFHPFPSKYTKSLLFIQPMIWSLWTVASVRLPRSISLCFDSNVLDCGSQIWYYVPSPKIYTLPRYFLICIPLLRANGTSERT